MTLLLEEITPVPLVLGQVWHAQGTCGAAAHPTGGDYCQAGNGKLEGSHGMDANPVAEWVRYNQA
jgi:hypothetical protein